MGLLNQNKGQATGLSGNTLGEATDHLRSFISDTIVKGDERDLDRITKYHLYWHFYENKHWKEYNHTLLSFNYVAAFIDKVSQFLLGKDSFSLTVKTYSGTPVEDSIKSGAEGLLNKTWNMNQKVLFSYELLQMGGVTGDVWTSVSWDKIKKVSRVSILDSRHCFPRFKEDDPKELDSFMYRVPLPRQNDPTSGKMSKYLLKVFRYTKENIESWLQDTTSINPDVEKYDYKSETNTYGVIPVVHIKNKPKSNSYFSTADSENIVKLNKIYNELSQEIKSIIDYYSAPTTIVTGATMNQLKKSLGNVWSGLPAEASVFNLGLDADLSSANNFLDRIKTAMHELSDVPENFLGKIQPISNTSGAALQLTYQPIIQQADLKWMTYGLGIKEINEMIISQNQLFNKEATKNIPSDFNDTHEVVAKFPYGFPTDKQNELLMAEQELRLRLNTRSNIMENMGYENIPKLLEDIKKDSVDIANIEGEVNEIVNPVSEPSFPPEVGPEL